jgi:hypothetical protein
MIAKPDGVRIKAALDAGENITVSWALDTTPALGAYDGGRGSSDTIFAVNVLQAGVYPMRCVYFNGGAPGSLEWFTVDSTGKAILLNDTAAGGLKTYQARTFVPPTPPALSVKASGNNVVITFEGTLQSATNVTGAYSDLAGVTSPYTNAATGSAKFFRAHR